MAGLRQLLMGGDSSGFCASHYETHCSEEPQHQRIVVRVLLPNGFPLQAVIDTASDWCILPSFIGLNDFLNKIPWAIDPDEELFFFGPVSDTHE